ncbi:MAG: hypothetical protein H0X37_12265 [Herpetosiphonaceae bacterium]|nr:hypothetical protein [Herpetosiphonaceae bacterium]
MLTVERFNQLLTPTGQTALHVAQSLDLSPAARLRTVGELRRQYSAELATDALEMAVLRERARVKFQRGAELYWTREALEQASGEAVAHHRAARYREWGSATDLCCSVGGDLLALAQVGVAVTGVDRDAVRLRMAEVNAEIYGVADRTNFLLADVTTAPLMLAPPSSSTQPGALASAAASTPTIIAHLYGRSSAGCRRLKAWASK